MAKHKISELSGKKLDAAVAAAEGVLVTPADEHPSQPGHYRATRKEWGQHIVRWFGGNGEEGGWEGISSWGTPSTDWSHGGPIIERERIQLTSYASGVWEALCLSAPAIQLPRLARTGPTPLIAAMRAFVATKFGDEVELP